MKTLMFSKMHRFGMKRGSRGEHTSTEMLSSAVTQGYPAKHEYSEMHIFLGIQIYLGMLKSEIRHVSMSLRK